MKLTIPAYSIEVEMRCPKCSAQQKPTGDIVWGEPASARVQDTHAPYFTGAVEHTIFMALEEASPEHWACDFSTQFDKYLPYYDHASQSFAVISCKRGQNAPLWWYRTKTAWQQVIKTHPTLLKTMMGIEQ